MEIRHLRVWSRSTAADVVGACQIVHWRGKLGARFSLAGREWPWPAVRAWRRRRRDGITAWRSESGIHRQTGTHASGILPRGT